MELKKVKTVWDDYYQKTILGSRYLKVKEDLLTLYLSKLSFNTALNIGANDGFFSRLIAIYKLVVAVDADANCVNELYKQIGK